MELSGIAHLNQGILRGARFQEARFDVGPFQGQHPAALVRCVGGIQERRVLA